LDSFILKPADILAYIFLAFAWGLSFITLLQVVEGFGWVGSVVIRSLVASGALLLFAKLSGKDLHFRGRWKGFAVIGATTVAGQLIGLSYATPIIGTAMAAILVATIPLFSLIIAQIWGVELVTRKNIAGLLLGFIGILMLVGFPAIPLTISFYIGCFACVASCICAAYGSNYVNRYLKGVGSWEITIAAFMSGAIMSAPLFYWVPIPRVPTMTDWLYLAIQAILMSALTYITYFKLVNSIGPTKAISVEFLVTVIAVVAGVFLLDETLTLFQLAGAFVILVGCGLVLDMFGGKKRQR
jgi:drug/metabolite transporter (DMT)-like permease